MPTSRAESNVDFPVYIFIKLIVYIYMVVVCVICKFLYVYMFICLHAYMFIYVCIYYIVWKLFYLPKNCKKLTKSKKSKKSKAFWNQKNYKAKSKKKKSCWKKKKKKKQTDFLDIIVKPLYWAQYVHLKWESKSLDFFTLWRKMPVLFYNIFFCFDENLRVIFSVFFFF